MCTWKRARVAITSTRVSVRGVSGVAPPRPGRGPPQQVPHDRPEGVSARGCNWTGDVADAAMAHGRACSRPPSPFCSPSRAQGASTKVHVGRGGLRHVHARSTSSWLQFVGADLIRPDRQRFVELLDECGALGVRVPAEGGLEGRYTNWMRGRNFRLVNVNARGLGDVEAYLTQVHGVRMPHLGKQKIRRYYEEGILTRALNSLQDETRGVVIWIQDGKILSHAELRYLALLPTIETRCRVVVELGMGRNFEFMPLDEAISA